MNPNGHYFLNGKHLGTDLWVVYVIDVNDRHLHDLRGIGAVAWFLDQIATGMKELDKLCAGKFQLIDITYCSPSKQAADATVVEAKKG